MRVRSEISRVAREVMHRHGFAEVETPNLTRSTPEGARDFVVPVRLQPGKWYALPQSPQLFKQLLMIGGLERYYQIARCFRDEDFRADRQPEFTQLDFEMSFVDRDDVLAIAEDVVRALWRELASYDVPEIPRMTYREAMDRFGSDKPDLRFGIELTELTSYFADTPFRVFQSPYVGAVVMPGGGSQPRRAFDAWQDWAKSRGAKGLAYVTIAEDGTLGGPVAKNISDAERDGLVAAVGAQPGDCVFFAAGARRHLAGAAGRRPQRDRQAAGAHRARQLVVPLRRRLPDVRGDRERRLDVHAPPVHLAHARVAGPVRRRQGRGAVRRLRHGDQRQRGDERLGAYPRRRRCRSGSSRRSACPARRPGSGSGSSSRPSPSGRRRTPVPRSAGTAVGAARRRGVDPRGHRLPEDRGGLRPADRGADADHRGAAHEAGIDAKPEEPPLPGQPGAPGPTDSSS